MKNRIYTQISCPVILGLCIATLSQNAQSHMLDGFEISGALGNSWYHSDDSTIQITFDERDANKVASSSSNLLYSAGIGRHLWTDALRKNKVMTGLLVQANYYYGETSVKGNVWGYESPAVNNYTFRAPMSSSRLMLDIKPELFVYKGFTPYGIIGAGASWNKMSYSESLICGEADPIGVVGLQEHSKSIPV